MNLDPADRFAEAVARCREKQEQLRTMEFRTLLFIYGMLADAHALAVEMRADAALRATFYRTLASENMRRGNDEVLILVEYLFFPHVLRRADADNKPYIDKASRYAKLIREAIAANTHPADFVRFARENGIQKTARAKPNKDAAQPSAEESGLGEPRETPPVEMKRIAVPAEAPDAGDNTFIGEVWFNSPKLSIRAAEAREAAKATPQVVSVRYITYPGKQKVVIGLEARPFSGPFPKPAIAPLDDSPFPITDRPEHRPPADRTAAASNAFWGGQSRDTKERSPRRRIGPGSPPPWPWQSSS
jgi:hypothetical protein